MNIPIYSKHGNSWLIATLMNQAKVQCYEISSWQLWGLPANRLSSKAFCESATAQAEGLEKTAAFELR